MRPTLLALLPIPLLIACPPSRSDDDDSACAGTGTLRVCATYGESTAAGSGAVRDADLVETDGLLDSEGCVDFTVVPGGYEWRASHATDSCVSSWVAVTVQECAVVEVAVQLLDWCFDG